MLSKNTFTKINETLLGMVGKDEEILWTGKPNLKCFVLEAIFNPLLPFAIVWALFDGFFITAVFHKGEIVQQMPFLPIVLIAFFAVHLMPVWIYLGGVLFACLRQKHTDFIITNKGVYASGGTFSQTFDHKEIAQIDSVQIHRGIFDQWIGVGDIILSSTTEENLNLPFQLPMQNKMGPLRSVKQSNITLHDLPDFQAAYELLKELKSKTN